MSNVDRNERMATHLGDDLIAKVVYTVGKNTPK
jgi:hypothetical protein